MDQYGLSGAGGIIRDANGDWVAGFSLNLGNCEILEAETMGDSSWNQTDSLPPYSEDYY